MTTEPIVKKMRQEIWIAECPVCGKKVKALSKRQALALIKQHMITHKV